MPSEVNQDIKSNFHKNGYVIVDSKLDDKILDAAISDLSRYFGVNAEEAIHVPYANSNRIQDGWHISNNVLAIAQSETIIKTLDMLYELEPRPFQTLNFYRGTQQPVHADNIHFNSEPFGSMCGVWIALEDIGPDQGPLVYYPGSHKLPEMNYEDFGLEGDENNYPQYLGELEKLIRKHQFEPEYGLIKKGQAVIWSANILHGGSKQNNLTLTRHSQVTHYYMGNPKCWRPSLSKTKRVYFEPEEPRDMSALPYQFPEPEIEITPLSIRRPIEFVTRAAAFVKRKFTVD